MICYRPALGTARLEADKMGGLIPLTDASRRPVHFPIVTICIIVANFLVFVLELKGGKASTTAIARAILQHDESQIEYYEKIVGNMVGRVLRNHGLVEKKGSELI
jgi:hypothetical protein